MTWVVFDHTLCSYVPVYWVLMTGKTALCYDYTFHAIKNDLNGKFNPWIIGIDFEPNFFKMCTKHWPDAHLIGCFFHFMQAIFRYLKDELKFPDALVSRIAHIVKIATVLPLNDTKKITGKTWCYIAERIDSIVTGDEEADAWLQSKVGRSKKTDFFAYIKNFWLRSDVICIWNTHAFANAEEDDLQPAFRTNCWMERYNRTTNEKFPTARPSLATFAETITAEQERILQLQEGYRANTDSPPVYAPVEWPQVPDDYDEYEVPDGTFKVMTLADRVGKKKRRKTTKKN